MKRSLMENREKKLFLKRFYPAGNYTWTVPAGCTEVDVFLVGGGAGGDNESGGGAGYTKTFKKDKTGWRDGDAVVVTPGELINVIVGKGGSSKQSGSYSQFKNSNYIVEGGLSAMDSGGHWANGGNGGSGGGSEGYVKSNGGSDGSNGTGDREGIGQGHTTRDFGEPDGKRNAGGGAGRNAYTGYTGGVGGASDYTEGKGEGNQGGGGYGGGGYSGNRGGDGTVLLRYWAYEE